MNEKKRIDFVDLAKGFCIIMVVAHHLTNQIEIDLPYKTAMSSFRMPFYFILSGLFFKTYESFGGFLKRKVNKLLIPFFFFYVTTTVLLPLFFHIIGYDVRSVDIIGIKSLYAFIYPIHQMYPNFPIWFLLCLFWCNVLFYIVFLLSDKFSARYSKVSITVICLLLGLLGYVLSKYKIGLPVYFDSALSALPFFCFGYILNRGTNVLYPNKYDRLNILFVLFCFTFVGLFSRTIDLSVNNLTGTWITILSCGICGALGVILCSKMIHRLPLISYFGRYSIIILCTHLLVMRVVLIVIKKFALSDVMGYITALICIMISYLIIIPFCKKFLPYVTAQKDVIKV